MGLLQREKVIAAFLSCALALPCLPLSNQEDYTLLWQFLETRYPAYHIVFVNEKEELLNEGAERSPVSTMPVVGGVKLDGLRIWTIKRGA